MMDTTFKKLDWINTAFPGEKAFELFEEILKETVSSKDGQDTTFKLAVCLRRNVKELAELIKKALSTKGNAVGYLEFWFRVLAKLQSLVANYISMRKSGCASWTQIDVNHYSMYVQTIMGGNRDKNEVELCLRCHSPSFAFKKIVDQDPRSIIFTSGTLSPMEGYSAEFGIPFTEKFTFPHVINLSRQVFTGIAQKLPSLCKLNFSFDNRDNPNLVKELGEFLIACFDLSPGGVLIFFTSYSVMNNYMHEWRKNGTMTKMEARKSISVETNRNDEDFKKEVNKFFENYKKRGAALFAVFGGKLSEGIDFCDDMARLVVLIGIPFPNVKSLDVKTKRDYLNTLQSNEKTLEITDREGNKMRVNRMSGSEWYDAQAIRGYNQAIGRVIRHRGDYGAALLLDERFVWPKFKNQISTWAHENLQIFLSTQQALASLKTFFDEAIIYCRDNELHAKTINSVKLMRRERDESREHPRRSKRPTQTSEGISKDLNVDRTGHQQNFQNAWKKSDSNIHGPRPVTPPQVYKIKPEDRVMVIDEGKTTMGSYAGASKPFKTAPRTQDSRKTLEPQPQLVILQPPTQRSFQPFVDIVHSNEEDLKKRNFQRVKVSEHSEALVQKDAADCATTKSSSEKETDQLVGFDALLPPSIMKEIEGVQRNISSRIVLVSEGSSDKKKMTLEECLRIGREKELKAAERKASAGVEVIDRDEPSELITPPKKSKKSFKSIIPEDIPFTKTNTVKKLDEEKQILAIVTAPEDNNAAKNDSSRKITRSAKSKQTPTSPNAQPTTTSQKLSSGKTSSPHSPLPTLSYLPNPLNYLDLDSLRPPAVPTLILPSPLPPLMCNVCTTTYPTPASKVTETKDAFPTKDSSTLGKKTTPSSKIVAEKSQASSKSVILAENSPNSSQVGPQFATTKCGHILCAECWRQCLLTCLECPVCRQRVRANNLLAIKMEGEG